MKVGLTVLAMMLLGIFAFVPSADAQQLTILSAQEDNGVLVVKGGPFAAGIRVFLPTGELSVQSVTASEIRATQPTVPVGTYLLFVYQPATNRLGTFVLSATTHSSTVVDGNGATVGDYMNDATVARNINGITVRLTIGINGFVPNADARLYYKTPNCTGSAYFEQGEVPIRASAIVDGVIYYAGESLEKFTPGSWSSFLFPCQSGDVPEHWFGLLQSSPVPTLSAPFHVR